MSYLNIPAKNTGDTLSSAEFNSIVEAIQNLQKAFGWASYIDTQYNSSSPQLIVGNDTYVTIANNAGSKIDTYLPYGVDKLYDESTNKIVSETVGRTFNGYISFKAKNNKKNGVISFGIDIGGAQGIILEQDLLFPKDANTEHIFSIPINAYTLDTFVANGGVPKVKVSTGDTVSIYDTVIFINVLSKPL